MNRLAGWAGTAAFANAFFAAAQFLTSSGDPRTNAVFGLLNNLAGVGWAVSFIPIAVFFYRGSRGHSGSLALVVLAIGVAAMTAAAGREVTTATGGMTFDQESTAYIPVLGGIGIWLVMSHGMELLGSAWAPRPRGLLFFGIGIGFAWFLANVLFGAGGLPPIPAVAATNELTDMGVTLFELGILLQPIWGLWLGRVLRGGGGPVA
ncbi:MAG TPA: hypothetical protein VM070_02160 [Candidatus Saccharimonadales bacterium]|nr:hypothetical protein [Candidatus Saccharimonadales bacterium]